MKKFLIGLAIITVGAAFAGCSSDKKQATDTAKTIEVTDSNGKVTVPVNPKKVVVFDNGSLDTMDALGVGDKVVGAATSNLPAYLADYKKTKSAGGIKEPDLEKINQMKPDLIIISGRQSDFLPQLKKIAPTLFLSVDNKKTWESISHNVGVLGKIFGKESQAKQKLADLETEIAKTKQKAEAKKAKTLTILVSEGQLSSFGEGSRFDIIYNTFGFLPADEEIKVSTHGQTVSYEYVLDKNPDILFVVDRTKAIGGDTSNNHVAENELVKQTNAGKTDNVYSLTPDVWYLSGGGLESVKLMLKDVNVALDK